MFRLLICILFSFTLCFSRQVVFCLHSKAEAVDVEGVIEQTIQKGHEVHVLAFGTAKLHLQPRFSLIELPEQLVAIGEKNPHVEDAEQIEALIKVIPSDALVISGLASKLQVALINQLENKHIIGVIDGFYTYDSHPFIHELDQSKLQMLFIPWEGMISFWKPYFSCPMFAVGKADLEERISRAPDPDKIVILYSGGYGPEYVKDFTLFVKAIEHWQKHMVEPHEIIISLHPAHHVDGSMERKVLGESCLKNVEIVSKDVPTIPLMEKAHVLITAYSTTTVKAMLNGLPAMHVSFGFSNVLTKAKIIPTIRSRRQFVTMLNQMLHEPMQSNFSLESHSIQKMLGLLDRDLTNAQCVAE